MPPASNDTRAGRMVQKPILPASVLAGYRGRRIGRGWIERSQFAKCLPDVAASIQTNSSPAPNTAMPHRSTAFALAECDSRVSSLCMRSTPTGTRTPVPWLRTKYPRPLDDGGSDTQRSILNRPQSPSSGRSPTEVETIRRPVNPFTETKQSIERCKQGCNYEALRREETLGGRAAGTEAHPTGRIQATLMWGARLYPPPGVSFFMQRSVIWNESSYNAKRPRTLTFSIPAFCLRW
jgi:hypothetical protein